MKPADHDYTRDETNPTDRDRYDATEADRSLTPPNDSAIRRELLDDVFQSDDPRVQSGIAESEACDDLDFIQSTGLTSPEASTKLAAIEGLPDLGDVASDPVSFYEPGVADVDAAMSPGLEADSVPPASLLDSNPETELDADTDGETTGGLDENLVASGGQREADKPDESFDYIDLDALDDDFPEPVSEAPPPLEHAIEVLEPTVAISPIPEPTEEAVQKSELAEEAIQVSQRIHEPETDREPASVQEVEPTKESAAVADPELDTTSVQPAEPAQAIESIENEEPVLEVEAESHTAPDPKPSQSPDVEVVRDAADSELNVPDDIDAPPIDPTGDGTDDVHETLDHSDLDDVYPDVPVQSHEPLIEAAGPPPPPEPELQDPYEGPATVQTYGRRSHRHHHRHEPAWPRMLRIAAIVLVFAGALAYGGYEAYRWFQIQVTNPTTLFYEAEAAAVNGKPLQSARLYQEFVQRNSGHPLVPEALFAAGYQMQQVDTDDEALARQYNEESLALLNRFTEQYPDHERIGRAHTLLGFVHYRMGDYRAAVDSFIGRDAMLRDPSATLPMLRTLARSYAHLGEYEAAHSTYVRAANAPGNTSPDADYDELGEMYRALAQSAGTPEEHETYQKLALEHWAHAMRYPGINPSRKNAIRVKADLLGELGAIEGTPPALALNQPANSGPAVPIEETAETSLAAFDEPIPLPFEPVPTRKGEPEPEPVAAAKPRSKETAAPPSEASPAPVQPRRAEVRPAPAARAADTPAYHEIAPGEMLSQIALDYGIPKADLMRWNAIENPDHIEVGQRLLVHEPAPPAD